MEVVPPGTNIDFIGKWKICVCISSAIILISLVAAFPQVRGIKLGLDFAGGVEMLVRFPAGMKADEGMIRSAVTSVGAKDPAVVRFSEGDAQDFLVRFQSETTGEKGELVDTIRDALTQQVGKAEIQRVDFVGPRVGKELRRDGLLAVGVSCIFILIYIAFRFSTRFAPGAVIALFHDIVITAGVFVLLGREFDLTVLAALLAILGYSLNDTIIVYDRIRENMAVHTKHDLAALLNLSVNQTLSRTLLTSGATMLAVLALLFLGGEVIRPFAMAMVIGIFVGTYSSIYIAAPTLLVLEERFGKEKSKKTAPPAKSGAKGGPKAARA
jgi:preprotein translocase subunit SecF